MSDACSAIGERASVGLRTGVYPFAPSRLTQPRAGPAWPLLGRREATWTEVVADAHGPWTLELEAARIGRLLRRWRVRLTLVEQADGQTRLRCRVSYRRASVAA